MMAAACVFCRRSASTDPTVKLMMQGKEVVVLKKDEVLHNEDLFRFFCQHVDMEETSISITSLKNIPNCGRCYIAYYKLHCVYKEIQALSLKARQIAHDLKYKVIESNGGGQGEAPKKDDLFGSSEGEPGHEGHTIPPSLPGGGQEGENGGSIQYSEPYPSPNNLMSVSSSKDGGLDSDPAQPSKQSETPSINGGTEQEAQSLTSSTSLMQQLEEHIAQRLATLVQTPSSCSNNGDKFSAFGTSLVEIISPVMNDSAAVDVQPECYMELEMEGDFREEGCEEGNGGADPLGGPSTNECEIILIPSDDEQEGPCAPSLSPNPSSFNLTFITPRNDNPTVSSVSGRKRPRKDILPSGSSNTVASTPTFHNGVMVEGETETYQLHIEPVPLVPIITKSVSLSLPKANPFGLSSSEPLLRRVLNGQQFYSCEQCSATFPSSTDHQDHQELMHNNQILFVCSVCDKIFSHPEVLESHERTHSIQGPYDCSCCKQKFLSGSSLASHLEKCGESFRSRKHTENYWIQDNHNSSLADTTNQPTAFEQTIPANSSSNISQIGGASGGEFACDTCPKSYKTLVQLQRHTDHVHKDFLCTICNHSLGYKYFEEHMNIHAGIRPHKCTICLMFFPSIRLQRRHLLLHTTGEKPYNCDECPRGFFEERPLVAHKRKHHSIEI